MKIVVFLPNWIGDVVMATPTLRALRGNFPQAHIVGLMRPYVAETLAGNPWLDDYMYHDHKATDRQLHTWPVIKKLRGLRFDIGVLLTNSFRGALMSWCGNIRNRVGYSREGRGLFLNHRLTPARGPQGYIPSPVIDYYLALAYAVGAPPQSYQMELFTSTDDERQADDIWQKFGFTEQDRVVVLNPGAAFGPAKRWPSQYFAELARRLVDQQGTKVIILCGPSERGFAQFIADGSHRPRQVKSLADEAVSLGMSKALIRRSSLLVTTDSGPRHFAAAFGVPAISLFGPTHIAWTETYYARETKLQKKLPCGPCQQRVCPLVHHRCMNELTVDEVYTAAANYLSAGNTRVAG